MNVIAESVAASLDDQIFNEGMEAHKRALEPYEADRALAEFEKWKQEKWPNVGVMQGNMLHSAYMAGRASKDASND